MSVLLFPQKKAIVKILRIPSQDSKEIAEMVMLQAARQTPLDPSDVVMDYQVLRKEDGGYSRVLLAIVQKKDLDEERVVFEMQNGVSERVILDSLASLPLLREMGQEESFCLVIEFQNGWMNLGIFQGNSLIGTRSAQVRNVVDEIKGTVAAYPPCPLPENGLRIRLAGNEAEAFAAQDVLCKEWGSCAEIVKPDLLAELPQNGHIFNLLPTAERHEKRQLRVRKKVITWAIRAALVLGVAGALISAAFYVKHRQLRKLERPLAGITKETQELRRMAAKISAVRAHENERQNLLNVIAELKRIAPERISLQSVNFEHGRSLLLQGNCFSLSQAVQLVEVMGKSPLFRRVELRSSNSQKSNDRDIVGFVVACEFS